MTDLGKAVTTVILGYLIVKGIQIYGKGMEFVGVVKTVKAFKDAGVDKEVEVNL